MKFTDFLNENSTGAFKVIDKILIDIDDDEMHVDIDFKQVVKQFEAEYVLPAQARPSGPRRRTSRSTRRRPSGGRQASRRA